MNIKVIDKSIPLKNIKLEGTKDVLKLDEVQEIKYAIREHLLFVGLDSCNNIRDISLLGIGSSKNVIIDTKEIIRMALLTASDKVILVHNHPSNSLKPSKDDLHITYITDEILKPFNIELLDHIIITEDNYMSMKKTDIYKTYSEENKELENMDKGFLIEENNKLKTKVEELTRRLEYPLEIISAQYYGNYNDTTVYNVKYSLNGITNYVTLEKKYDAKLETDKWLIEENVELEDKYKKYIIETVSKNPPIMNKGIETIYNDIFEIEMEK